MATLATLFFRSRLIGSSCPWLRTRAACMTPIPTRSNDAPKLETAFRLFKLVTVHFGVESLRCARGIIARTRHVYFHIPRKTSCRGCAVKKDFYGRFLLDIWLQRVTLCDRGPLRLLLEVLAEAGHTVAILTDGLDKRVFDAMVNARESCLGLFCLSNETRECPFRPWDLRKDSSVTIDAHHHCDILGQHSLYNEPVTFFRVTTSTKATEGLVYPAPSTITGAGFSLFLRPQFDRITADSYLCTHATTWTQRRPYSKAGSYLLEVVHNRKLRFYDASSYDGVNVGRFTNEHVVLNILKELCRDGRTFCEFREEDWKKVNDRAAEQANARFAVGRGGHLQLIATRDFAHRQSAGIFTTYGDLRYFWIAAIFREPECFPPAMVETVRFLFNSLFCNWTLAQKQSWGICEGLIDGDGRLRTLSNDSVFVTRAFRQALRSRKFEFLFPFTFSIIGRVVT